MTRFSLKDKNRVASENTLLAEIGSLSLEFTRLSQLTVDTRYFEAIQKISDVLEASLNNTLLPGLWPTVIDAKKLQFQNNEFTLGGMADSAYEYLPKQHLLLGGSTEQYKNLYENAMVPIINHIFFRPLTPENVDILVSGSASVNDAEEVSTEAIGQHLVCFAGGIVGLGAKLFNRPDDLAIARKLVDGCIWAYSSTQTGIMPELFRLVPCKDPSECEWSQEIWRGAVVGHPEGGNLTDEERNLAQSIIKEFNFPPGFYAISDRTYKLRPEAIESVFILYRLTGDPALLEAAWKMFKTIEEHTRTNFAHAGLNDVMNANSSKENRMESFWLSETLKYFALIFNEPEVLSLDEYVL